MNQEIAKFEQEQKGIQEQVNSLTVQNQKSYEEGAIMKVTLSSFRKKLTMFFDPMVSKAKDAYDEVRGTRDKYLKPAKELEDTVKDKLKSYEREMERKAEEERKKGEAEKQRKIDEENKKRKEEAEQRAKDEAEVLGVDKIEVEKIEEATVEDIEVEQPLATIDKVKGLGIRKRWIWKITDISKIPKEYFILDEMLIGKEVRGLKEKFNVPGIRAYED